MSKNKMILSSLLLIAICAIAAVVHLQAAATASRDAELKLADLQLQLRELQDIPWQAAPTQGGDVRGTRRELAAAERKLATQLGELSAEGVATGELERVATPLELLHAPLWQIITSASRNDMVTGSKAAGVAWGHGNKAAKALVAAGDAYRAHAEGALRRALYGSAAAIGLLFAAFAFFLRRASRAREVAEDLARRNHELLELTQEQATTDALTGLPNRRALTADLVAALERATPEEPVLLALFDLDGFKQYNDTFGHPSGDALLARLGDRLTTTLNGLGSCYRMGGDEFCVLAPAEPTGGEAVIRLAAAALTESGDAFEIGCSYGVAVLPHDASTPEEALGVADQAMYAQKTSGRASASRQSTDVLVRVLGERSAALQDHIDDVARLAEQTARNLALPEQDVQTIRLAAELHDIGKTAIPDGMLTKRGKLDDEEWAFMRCHTLIGERIVLAAPSLSHTARIIRASHERIDGSGYPDQLRGEEIPLGARIVAVCDAYDAMVSDRPYRDAIDGAEAIAELKRCAGTQFDDGVVRAFVAIAEQQLAERQLRNA